jgi:hypothetical protein
VSAYLNYYYELPGSVRLQLTFREPLRREDEVLMSAYIPGIGDPASTCDSQLRMSMVLALRAAEGHYSFRINESLEHKLSHGSLLFAEGQLSVSAWMSVYVLLRKLWLDRMMFPWHAAAVNTPSGVVLLVGHSGSGKSTVASLLSRAGCSLVSGNKTLIKPVDCGLSIIGGTYCHTMRSDDWKEVRTETGISRFARYGDRIAQNFAAGDFPKSVSAVYLVKLSGVNDRVQIGYPQCLHRLYPLAIDAVNSSIVLGDGEALVSFEPDALKLQAAVRQLASALATMRSPVIELQGAPDYIAGEILKG